MFRGLFMIVLPFVHQLEKLFVEHGSHLFEQRDRWLTIVAIVVNVIACSGGLR